MKKYIRLLDFFLLIVLLSILIITYHRCFNFAQFYYDDIVNIFNSNITSNSLSIPNIIKALSCHIGGTRPVSYVTFYINYIFCYENPNCYFMINFLIHCLNTIFIYCLLKEQEKTKPIAVIVAFLWALSPVNFLTTAYIVQRMTLLMTFFGLLSLMSLSYFLKTKRKKYWLISFFLITLSALSKENGILFAPFLIAPFINSQKQKTVLKTLLPVVTVLLIIVFSFIFKDGYKYIGITPIERLLTESRVVVFYLKNLIFPTSKDLFLYLDFPISKNIFNPITTLFSILGIISICISIYLLRKKEKFIIYTGILFFYFQLLESTTIPLRTAFFQRMYLPSLFFYTVLIYLLYSIKPKFYFYIAVFLLIFNNFYHSINLSAMWTSKTFFLQENLKYFPKNYDLLFANAEQLKNSGETRKALTLLRKAQKLAPNKNKFDKTIISYLLKLGKIDEALYNTKLLAPSSKKEALLAQIYSLKNQPQNAIFHFELSLKAQLNPKVLIQYLNILEQEKMFNKTLQIVKLYPTFPPNINNKLTLYKINALINTNQLKQASELLKTIRNCPSKQILSAMLLIKNKQYKKALKVLKHISIPISNFKLQFKVVVLTCQCYEKLNSPKQKEQYLESIKKQYPFGNIFF